MIRQNLWHAAQRIATAAYVARKGIEAVLAGRDLTSLKFALEELREIEKEATALEESSNLPKSQDDDELDMAVIIEAIQLAIACGVAAGDDAERVGLALGNIESIAFESAGYVPIGRRTAPSAT